MFLNGVLAILGFFKENLLTDRSAGFRDARMSDDVAEFRLRFKLSLRTCVFSLCPLSRTYESPTPGGKTSHCEKLPKSTGPTKMYEH